MRIKRENVFVNYLALLGVRYTESFSNQYFNEHPQKNNLFGLSKMLSDYGIPNAAARIDNKETDLFNIELPFVAHVGGDFAVVYKIESDKINYLRNGKRISIPVSQFIQSWSGVILLAEASPDSCEPDYTAHRKKELLHIAQRSILALAGILILGLAYINYSLFNNLGVTLLLAVNLIGIYICYLLVLQQMHIQSRYADKICSLFSKSDCNNVLESDAAKLWGIFGWSEIGLGYFAANVVILLFLPHLMTCLALINILALPYTAWSVWYQRFKARQWCPLCLIVQVLLWCIFVLNAIFGHIQPPVLDLQTILLVGCIYAVPIFALSLSLPKLSEGDQVGQLRQEINSIKANEGVFKELLTQQPFYEAGTSDSQIIFGNPNANLRITILTNPFCNPCAKMHKRVEILLKETNENVSVQYIFSAFNESLEYANRYFNAIYLEKGEAAARQLFADWFEEGKSLKEAFFNDLQLDISNPAVEVEFQKHESWKAKKQLRTTPVVLVNGYLLPANYKIEDLRWFTEFIVDNK